MMNAGAKQRTLWYFADPMCSWCWGFAPVIEAIKDQYRGELKIALILGGLRVGTTEPVTPAFREQTLAHWRDVEAMTGQPFAHDGALPEGFVYDTEPACRAVATVGEIKPELSFSYLKSVQAAFYTQGQDVTQPMTLAGLVDAYIPTPRFLRQFDSSEMKERTRRHFAQARRVGVRSFPTAILQQGEDYALLTQGYRAFPSLQRDIDAWLTRPT